MFNSPAVGIFALVALGAIINAVGEASEKQVGSSISFGGAFVFALAALVWCYRRKFRILTREIIEDNRKRAVAEAHGVCKKATRSLALLDDLRAQLEELATTLSDQLNSADDSYEQHRLVSFWACIEAAAETIRALSRDYRIATSEVRAYLALLKGRRHTFPIIAVPTSSATVSIQLERFDSLLARAEQSAEFANVFVQAAPDINAWRQLAGLAAAVKSLQEAFLYALPANPNTSSD